MDISDFLKHSKKQYKLNLINQVLKNKLQLPLLRENNLNLI